MIREIVVDTETTGLDPHDGHRLVEIAGLELLNHVPSGRLFHTYVNPEREVPSEVFAIHGLSYDFLKNHPLFKDVGSSFLEFIGDDPLIIHNAKFDMKFLNAELQSHGWAALPLERATCTLTMARKQYPGSPASLDALCKRFQIDNTGREKHGARIDVTLLAQVYLELKGGKQPGFSFPTSLQPSETLKEERQKKTLRPSRRHQPTPEESEEHQNLLQKLRSSSA